MPGANCSVFGCGSSRQHVGIGIFLIPSGEDEISKRTREAWLKVITKGRVIDTSLQRQINSGSLYVCEKKIKGRRI